MTEREESRQRAAGAGAGTPSGPDADAVLDGVDNGVDLVGAVSAFVDDLVEDTGDADVTDP